MQIQHLIQQAKQKNFEKSLLVKIHHVLMSRYGWIGLEEFKQLPIPTVFALLAQIEQEQEKTKDGSRRSRH